VSQQNPAAKHWALVVAVVPQLIRNPLTRPGMQTAPAGTGPEGQVTPGNVDGDGEGDGDGWDAFLIGFQPNLQRVRIYQPY
jgi:hypothetical protein